MTPASAVMKTSTSANVPEAHHSTRVPSILPFGTSLSMAPKKEPQNNEGTNEVDWGKVAGMFVNPLNPYAWFVYFFVGINVYGFLQQS